MYNLRHCPLCYSCLEKNRVYRVCVCGGVYVCLGGGLEAPVLDGRVCEEVPALGRRGPSGS